MSSANMNAEGEAVTCARQIELNPQGGARTNLHLPQEESGSDGYPRPCKINSPAGESNGQGKGEDSESNGDGGKDTISSKEIPDKSSEKTQTMDSHCSSESCIPTPSCRICFQGAEQGDLLSPCRCDGSVRHAHQQCLLKWISERGSWTCELCNYRFHIVAMTIKKPCQWQAVTMTLVEKVQTIAVFLGAVFLLASVSWLLWSALSPEALWQRRDILFQICYGMYGLMDLVCIGLIVHEGGAVYRVWMRWRAVNLLWDVQNYDKGQDLEEATGSRVTPTPPRTLWLPLTTLGSSVTHTHTTRLEPSPRCPLHLLSLCLRTTPDPPGQEEGSGEVVLRVTSV